MRNAYRAFLVRATVVTYSKSHHYWQSLFYTTRTISYACAQRTVACVVTVNKDKTVAFAHSPVEAETKSIQPHVV